MKRRRALALCLFVFFVFAACRVKPLDPPVTSLPADTETTPPPTQTAEYEDEPAVDYGGAPFKILIPWADKFISAETGTEKYDFLEKTMMDLHDKFNINILLAPISGMADLVPSASAGIYYADIVGLRAYEIAGAAAGRYIYPLDDPLIFSAGLNPLDKKRWHTGVSDKLLYDGRQWTTQIASRYDFPSFGTFILYNKDIISRLGSSNLASLVETDKWAWRDYLMLSEKAAAEKTADGRSIIGTALENDLLPILSNGGQFIEHRDGAWVTSLRTSPLNGGLDYLRHIYNTDGLFTGTIDEKLQLFADGRAAFFWMTSETLIESDVYGLLNGDCGILPLPKRGTARETVHTVSAYRGYAVTTASPDAAKAVTLFNAWALRLNDPDWFDAYAGNAGLDRADADMLEYRVLGSGVYNNAEMDQRIINAVNGEIVTPFLESDRTAYDVTGGAEAMLEDLIAQYLNAPGEK